MLTLTFNRNLYWNHCNHNVDCLFVTLSLSIKSCSYDDTVSAKDTNHRLASHTMVFVIVFLYVLDILSVAFEWSFGHWVFIDNGWNFWRVFVSSYVRTPEFTRRQWVQSVSGVISTVTADASLVCQFVITH